MAIDKQNAPHSGVAADKAWSVEQHGIDPIPLRDRHGTPAVTVEIGRAHV